MKYAALVTPDSGFSWLVLAAAFVNVGIAMGTTYGVGVFIVEWMDAFDSSPETVSWVGAINIATVFGLAPLPSYLATRVGHRPVAMAAGVVAASGYVISSLATNIYVLYFSYGILSGLGTCSAYTTSAVIPGFYFDRWRSLVLILASVGGGIGNIVFAPFYRFLIREFTWRGAMLITGGITLHYTCFGATFLPTRDLKHSTPETRDMGKMAAPERPLFKDYRIYVMMLSHTLWTLGSAVFFMYVVDFAQTRGISRDDAAYAMSAAALGGLLIRVVVSVVFARAQNLPSVYLYLSFCIGCGVSVILLPLASSYSSILAVCCSIYTCYGGLVVTLGLTTVQMFGLDRATSVFGLLMFACGVGGVAGPPLAALLYKSGSSNGYLVSFIFGGVALMISGALAFVVIIGECKYQHKTKSLENKRFTTNQANPGNDVKINGHA